MKQPENNEIDSLLRSWAGRRRSVSTELAENGAGVHMDADELNSYAEGALPLSTRARYTAHLADCDDCRKLVAQLAVAAGPMINERAIGQQRETAGWRKALAAFFAPSVMRYALPALALVIIGVFFFASRRQNERASVALTTQTETKPAIEPSKQTGAETFHNDDRTAADQTRVAPSQVSRAAQAGAGKEKEQKASNAPAASTEAGKQQEEQKKETASIAAKERRPDAVAQPAEAPPPAAAKPASSVTPKDKNIVIDGLADMKEAGARKREPARPASGAGGKLASADSASAKDDERQKAKNLTVARANEAERDEGGETKSIVGRRFQRHNAVWIDSAYKSSMSTVNVSRGSEQYRALVADEPEIGAIAKQLSGEVFVIWKGRAYHIK